MLSRRSTDVGADGVVSGKRRRTKTNRYDSEFLENEEQRMIQQALKISKLDQKRSDHVIPFAPTFYPTEEEFKDSLAYVRKIRKDAEQFGICKIVPPKNWKPPCNIHLDNMKTFKTRLQPVNTLQEGQGFDDGKQYTYRGYKEMADHFYNNWIEKHHKGEEITLELLAKDYWDLVETNREAVTVEYGNDIDTSQYSSGFPSATKNKSSQPTSNNTEDEATRTTDDMNDSNYYAHSTWNLNNMPSAPGSLLHFLTTGINGINVPWLYMGMLFASFCWHTEDNFFYSINYSHFGGVKQWYGVPGSGAELFEKVSKDFLMGLFRETPDILHHMTTQISPQLLLENGVPVYQAAHEPGTFIITFPRSYHGGFSYGFNCGEAVNFATIDWLHYGDKANNEYRVFARASVFSHQRLLFTLYHNIKDLAKGACAPLLNQIMKMLDEEINGRNYAIEQGVKDLSKFIKLPCNDFTCIDEKATNYDDMRSCHICKQACIFTAIGCECDRSKVGCLRHFPYMCKCAIEKKFLLAWSSTEVLRSMREEASEMKKINDKKK